MNYFRNDNVCCVCVQVKHRRMSNTYIRCMEWEYWWTHVKFIDSEFLKVHQQQTESGGLSEGKKSPLLARLYNNTYHILTEMDKLVLH